MHWYQNGIKLRHIRNLTSMWVEQLSWDRKQFKQIIIERWKASACVHARCHKENKKTFNPFLREKSETTLNARCETPNDWEGKLSYCALTHLSLKEFRLWISWQAELPCSFYIFWRSNIYFEDIIVGETSSIFYSENFLIIRG